MSKYSCTWDKKQVSIFQREEEEFTFTSENRPVLYGVQDRCSELIYIRFKPEETSLHLPQCIDVLYPLSGQAKASLNFSSCKYKKSKYILFFCSLLLQFQSTYLFKNTTLMQSDFMLHALFILFYFILLIFT